MIEILPIKSLRDEDAPIFGSLNVLLSKLNSLGLPVAKGIVVTPPNLKLKTILEHHEFTTYEVFEQSLMFVKKELQAIPIPDELSKELKGEEHFLVENEIVKGVKNLWLKLIDLWVLQLKQILWTSGFSESLTEKIEPILVGFMEKPLAYGETKFDEETKENEIIVKIGRLDPKDIQKLDQIISEANKKLIIPHNFSWVLDSSLKLVGVSQYTSVVTLNEVKGITNGLYPSVGSLPQDDKNKTAVKVFLDLSTGEIPPQDFESVYLVGEKIYDLNKPQESFDNLVIKMLSVANSSNCPILLKLADKSEGMGKVRGALRLIHQKSLLNPFIEAVTFVLEKEGLKNLQIVIPFVRGANELLEIKRQLAVKKITRRTGMGFWLELAVPENFLNLEEYLVTGLDGVVINLDELAGHLGGFDREVEEVSFYKHQVEGLIKFIEESLKILHKAKIPFLAYGSLVLNPKVLDFLVEKGVYGLVVERYEADASKDLISNAEKSLISKRNS